ncbi:unnamed protein product [Prunus armeniaca]
MVFASPPACAGTGPKTTVPHSSTHPDPSPPPPPQPHFVGKHERTAGFDPNFLEHVLAISTTNFFDLGIGMDWRFGDFLIACGGTWATSWLVFGF